MIFEHNMNFILSLSVFYLILSDVSSSLVPRETLAASQIIKKKKTLKTAVNLPRTVLKGKRVYHYTLSSMRGKFLLK